MNYFFLITLIFLTILPMMWIVIYYKCLVDIYGMERYMYNDVMNYCMSYKPFGIDLSLGFWSITHFIIYCIAIMLCPSEYVYNVMIYGFFVGILWEIIEDMISYFVKGKDLNKKHSRRDVLNNNELQYTNWWAGSSGDIIYNIIGMATGYIIRTYEFYNGMTFILFFIPVHFSTYSATSL